MNEPEYLKHCAYRDCDKPGHVYTDKLFPINFCDDHAAMRHKTMAKAKERKQ